MVNTPTPNDSRRSSRLASRQSTPARISFDSSRPAVTPELETVSEAVEELPEELPEVVESAPVEPPQPLPRKKRGKLHEPALSVVDEQDEPSKTTTIEDSDSVTVVEDSNEQREHIDDINETLTDLKVVEEVVQTPKANDSRRRSSRRASSTPQQSEVSKLALIQIN